MRLKKILVGVTLISFLSSDFIFAVAPALGQLSSTGDDSDAGGRDESERGAAGDAIADRDLAICDRSHCWYTGGRRAVEDRGGLQSGPDSADERPGPDPAGQRADRAAAVLRPAGQ